MEELVLSVKGMMCEGCENRVQNVVKDISGVADVHADHKTGKVTITFNGEADIEEIKETIDDIGYEVE